MERPSRRQSGPAHDPRDTFRLAHGTTLYERIGVPGRVAGAFRPDGRGDETR